MLLDEYVIICEVTGLFVKDNYQTWGDQTNLLSKAVIFDSHDEAEEFALWHFMISPAYTITKLT